ncbi:MAG: microcystin-dependent protein [Arenicella sp.]|jgi:microcystin-dependent protein
MRLFILFSLSVISLTFNFSTFAQSDSATKVVVIPLLSDDAPMGMEGVTYTALAPIVISTPDVDKPNEQLISFTVPADQNVQLSQPSLVLYYVIALQGVYPSRSLSTDPILASKDLFGGNFAPRGWALCQGQLLSISQNTALFSLLGTTYGGDGRTTFGLPDLRGRVAVGVGSGPGLSTRGWGQRYGAESTNVDHR